MSPRLLVADDDPGIRDVVTYALRHEGFETETVVNGADALEAARTGSYDLLILDLMMPALSGIEVCRMVERNTALTMSAAPATANARSANQNTEPSRPNAPRKITIAVMMASTRRATRRMPHPLRRCWTNTCVGGCYGGG